MSQTDARIGPSIHPDVYPVARVSTEFFLRGFDLLCQLDDDVVSGLIFMTLWQDALSGTAPEPMGIRELSRRLDLPYETVRRHVHKLSQSGICLVEDGGITIPSAVRRSPRFVGMQRKIYVNAVRLLGDLTRVAVANFKSGRSPSSRSRRMSMEQTSVAVAAIGLLVAGMKTMRDFFDGDLMNGLVFTGIWAANVKHVINAAPAAAYRGILPDADRLPVSAQAISESLHLPYETVRRHAGALVKQGKCKRVAYQGLVVPKRVFRQMTVESAAIRQLILGFVAELRAAGIKV